MPDLFDVTDDSDNDLGLGEGVVQPDSSTNPGQSDVDATPEAGSEGQPVEPTEEEISKLDLAQPEHLRTFRSTYEKNRTLLTEALQREENYKAEIQRISDTRTRSIYLDTDVPIEDFKADDTLARLAEEEPEYYDRVVESVHKSHFWPSIADEFRTIEGKDLDPKIPLDQMKLDQMDVTWDILSRRITQGALNGNQLATVIDVINASPDLQQIITLRSQGQTAPSPNGNGYGQPQTGQGYRQPPAFGQPQQPQIQVQSLDVIAQQGGLDLSDPTQATTAQTVQNLQRYNLQLAESQQRERDANQRSMNELRGQVEELRGQQTKLQGVGEEEAVRRAESRLKSQLDSSLTSAIEDHYKAAVPKDRPELLGKLRTLTEKRLADDPNYTRTTATAEKWFKQSATAKTTQDRDRWDRKGLDALSTVVVFINKALAAEAQELLGPIRTRVQAQNKKTADLGNKREFTGGRETPPTRQQEPIAAAGDLQAGRAAIRRRMELANLKF